jgi:hypothetical protein
MALSHCRSRSGATGILVGAALKDDPDADPPIQRDDMVMLALTDPDRATRISMNTQSSTCVSC